MKPSESMRTQLTIKRYHLTLRLRPAVRAHIEQRVEQLERELAAQLQTEAQPGYKEPEFRMPAWGTYGT